MSPPAAPAALAAARRALAAHEAGRVRRPEAPLAPGVGRAAVALILLEDRAGLETLLIRRAERAGDPWSGQVALPGGRHDPRDPDLLATAIRETREETGVELGRAERLGVLDDLSPRSFNVPPVVVRPFVFALSERPPLVPGDEVQRAFWLPLNTLRDPGVSRPVALSVRGVTRTVAAYQVGGEVIWGLTERIVTSFLAIL